MEVLSTSLEGHSHGSKEVGEKKGVCREVFSKCSLCLGCGNFWTGLLESSPGGSREFEVEMALASEELIA